MMIKKVGAFIAALAMMVTILPVTAQAQIIKMGDVVDEGIRDDYFYLSDDDTIDTDTVYSLTSRKAKSADEIQQFTNLTAITVFDYEGEELDLSMMPNLYSVNITSKKLKTLKLADPSNITDFRASAPKLSFDFSQLTGVTQFCMSEQNIDALDMSFANRLTWINIYDCPKLAKLDITKNPSLKTIYLTNTAVANLDVSKNPLLKEVSITDSKLTKADFKENKSLKYLSLNGNKKLSTLNISKNTELVNLNVGLTAVKKLDVTKNKNLTSLRVYNTKLSTLNIKNNTSLETINIRGTKINKLNLTNVKNLLFEYDKTKNNTLIKLKGLLGTGYKEEWGSKNFNAKDMTFKVKYTPSSKSDSIVLVKGDKRIVISANNY